MAKKFDKSENSKTTRKPKRTRSSSSTNRRDFNSNRDVDTNTKRSEHNDFSWYNKNPGLLRAAANISFGNGLGYPVDPNNTSNVVPTTISGIMALYLLPGPGVGSVDVSAVNMAADNLYAYIRQAQSGGKNYDPNDLMSYLLCFDELYSMYFYAVRAFATINLYNAQNRYIPKYLIEAMNWDYDDIMENLADLKYNLQGFAARMNNFNVPGSWPYYKRHAWIYSNIFLDSTSPKAQVYVMNPIAYRVRNDENSGLHVGRQCTVESYEDNDRVYLSHMTVSKWCSIMNEMIGALTNSSDVGLIGGDIRKAFPESDLIKFKEIPDAFTILPVYDESVLSQFENCTYFEGVGDIDIVMDNSLHVGNVVYNPTVWVSGRGFGDQSVTNVSKSELLKIMPASQPRLINIHHDNPSVEDVTLATRLVTNITDKPDEVHMYNLDNPVDSWVVGESGTGAEDYFAFIPVTSCGAEIVARIEIYTLTGANLGGYWYPPVLLANNTDDMYKSIIDWAYFKHHPINYITMKQSGSTTCPTKAYPVVQADTYTLLKPSECANIHDACLLSLFNVPLL